MEARGIIRGKKVRVSKGDQDEEQEVCESSPSSSQTSVLGY